MSALTVRHRLPRLRHWRDWQSLAYLVAYPALVVWMWAHGFSFVLYGVLLFLTLGIGVIHHNHTHRRMWHGRWANRLTDFWITLLQGHPTCVFYPAHVGNHHRYKHGPQDVARTYRFGGDTNHLLGYLLHPLQAGIALYPHILGWLSSLRRHWPGVWRYCMAQYAVWLTLWGGVLIADPVKGLVYVIIPQLHGLHWLLATNYLQHAHADGSAHGRVSGPDGEKIQQGPLNYARNFEGLVNPLLFNIGLHTAHHEHSRTHWAELTHLHRDRYRHRVDPTLNESGLVPYMTRVFVLGTVMARYRSRSLMSPQPAPAAVRPIVF
ncbi:fatty acid desaturase [Alcaligenaceae bacterium A4P071]|nr:fatty acid desaturase [Alcaligenaceae bacterium B3P038]MDQ2184243.1 fatty acid desaturase [Alcaligenaceae bacterium A4P071]